jgi:hypothetical protein
MSTVVAGNSHRRRLFRKFESVIATNPRLDRSLVSFQANRKLSFYRWLKYKEGFAAKLVEHLLDEYGATGGTLLDPFAGIGTSVFVARERGINSIGIELMPVGFLAMESRLSAERASAAAFQRKLRQIGGTDWRTYCDERFAMQHIPITEGAFPFETESAITGYRAFCSQRIRDHDVRKLFQVAGISVLEDVSYTRKDGQYLRWDTRSKKPRVKANFDKGEIKRFDQAIRAKLQQMDHDLRCASSSGRTLFDTHPVKPLAGSVDLRRGSCLQLLPDMASNSVDLVVTSPPYCNRYDYTRTYALELVYLGLDQESVKSLRQAMLSCTVENQAKSNELRHIYEGRGKVRSFEQIHKVFNDALALHEVLDFLDSESQLGRLNNSNIPRMVRNYFFEICFVIFELSRVLKPGGRILMVNDNVRYAGEEVPVDLVLSHFAERFGLQVEQIWTLPRGKGNSSQQMGAHGRAELRKCVYVWRKL